MRISNIKKFGWLEILGFIQHNLLKTVLLKLRPLTSGFCDQMPMPIGPGNGRTVESGGK